MKLDVQGQGGGRILDVAIQGGWGLENWTILMDVIFVSSFTCFLVMLINDNFPVKKFSFRLYGYDMFYQITKKVGGK